MQVNPSNQNPMATVITYWLTHGDYGGIAQQVTMRGCVPTIFDDFIGVC